ncbi:uncharacterized protein TRAVEDRAFT_48080 [Trametes versicolor FP-101664 SS1]|uniref:uncharacterized protein n=1 Tax=Trametes versicolor (strain FP-101664) TaxID=717944 RepID=UPI00046216D9|nr:uncharacterized protein TRAVEDRAFT_48080 [Trametes versicolor FP-101664 SS1]EIW58940.1 hypothetical protein TRAVEDRAFT_48080 [Trametes versicolor FP-101664 SS1]
MAANGHYLHQSLPSHSIPLRQSYFDGSDPPRAAPHDNVPYSKGVSRLPILSAPFCSQYEPNPPSQACHTPQTYDVPQEEQLEAKPSPQSTSAPAPLAQSGAPLKIDFAKTYHPGDCDHAVHERTTDMLGLQCDVYIPMAPWTNGPGYAVQCMWDFLWENVFSWGILGGHALA